MNQPAGPYWNEEVDYSVERGQQDPYFVADPIPLKNRVSLYFTSIGVDECTIQHLVYLKTLRAGYGSQATQDCDHNEQKRIAGEVAQLFERGSSYEGKQIQWRSDKYGQGQYAASGILHQDDFNLSFCITDEEAAEIKLGNSFLAFPAMPLPDNHPARVLAGDVYEGAKDRFEKNCQRFKGRVAREEWQRRATQGGRQR